MKYFSCGDIIIPLNQITGLSYNKASRIVEGRNYTLRFLGYSPIEVALQLSIDYTNCDSVVDECKKWFGIGATTKTRNAMFLDSVPFIPSLLFTLTSISRTVQSDVNGNVQRIDISLTFSGSECQKREAVTTFISYDESKDLPKLTWYCRGKAVDIGLDMTVDNLVLTPTTANITLLLATPFKSIPSAQWLVAPTKDSNTYVSIEGRGNYYIQNATLDDTNALLLECSIFPIEYTKQITKTMFNTTLQAVLHVVSSDKLPINIKGNVLPISYININYSVVDLLKELNNSVGYMLAIRDNVITLYDTPKSINTEAYIDYYINTDIASIKTNSVILRDGVHEYIAGNIKDGTCRTFEAPFTMEQSRANNVLEYVQMAEREINMRIAIDERIKHHSIVNIIRNNKQIPCIVTDYVIDYISGYMDITLCYTYREGD